MTTRKMIPVLCMAIIGMVVAGCINMPTPPDQITGVHTSHLKYKGYDCDDLSTEFNSLARREAQLTTAQDQRYKTSQVQSLVIWIGQGDSVEASELAVVRGEKEAVRRMMEEKKCNIPATTAAKEDTSSQDKP